MKDRSKRGTHHPKRPYMRPEVKQVPLTPEEAVLGFCKVEGVGDGPEGACTTALLCPTSGS